MMTLLDLLASPRLTLAGLVWLGMAVLAQYRLPELPSWQLVLPLALLALNLAAALVARPGLRASSGLFAFHLALIALMLLGGWGRLTHLDGRVEIVEGQAFSSTHPEISQRGPWHRDRLAEIDFVQGAYTVDYRPKLNRAHTLSEVVVLGKQFTVGDIEPLILSGYRFYTTYNKGYALLLTWIPDAGRPETGAIHLPSFPLNDWQQKRRWQAPGGPQLDLILDPGIKIDYLQAWQLDSRQLKPLLKLQWAKQNHELRPGQTLQLEGGRIHFEGVRGWMGYRIFYDPTLPWLLGCAIAGVLALAWHLLGRFAIPKLTMGFQNERSA